MKNNDLKYAYFPGCASKYAAAEYDHSTRKMCEKLGIKLVDLDFSCCGAGVLKEVDRKFNQNINARNFALAEDKNLSIMTICSTCILNLMKDKKRFEKDKKALFSANEMLKQFDLKSNLDLELRHLLWILAEEYGIDRLKEFKKMSFNKLKIAGYYGCHIVRPSNLFVKYNKNGKPDEIERIISAFGGIPVELDGKTDCCGFHISLINQKAANRMSSSFMQEAKEKDVDIIITVCPFCHLQIDVHQKEKIPILHLSQFVGLGIGLSLKELKINKHVTKFKESLLK